MTGIVPEDYVNGAHARRDWVDLRDQPYLPSLSVLRDRVDLDRRLLRPLDGTGLLAPVFGVRDQTTTQRCVGYALAALIDIQRNLQRLGRGGPSQRRDRLDGNADDSGPDDDGPGLDEDILRDDIASADMLYRVAYFHDRYPDPDSDHGPDGIRSLRSAIKGFYHHGACLDWPRDTRPSDLQRWQSTCYFPGSPDERNFLPNADQALGARMTGLGAYFRLASVLNHYHAALNDAEAVLVTANIHDGWRAARPGTDGRIQWPPELGITGSHAVVLVGYDEAGFHVLNSWGAGWGGYRGCAGIGHWDYADWARNVIDAWVLRLGVRAPKAFGVSIGERGVKGLHGAARSGSTPCHELSGHYMHLDDGFHVTSGSYPSFPSGWSRTVAAISEGLRDDAEGRARCKGLLVWIPGSFEGIKPAFTAAVARKSRAEGLGLYPYTIFWCNGFVEKSLEVLDIIFGDCKAQAGVDAAHLDRLIEDRIQGVGRAFWREMEMSALRAVWGAGELPHEPEARDPAAPEPGYVAAMLSEIVSRRSQGCEIHLVTEGAGVLVLDEMLSFAERRLGSDAASLFASLHLVHPAIGLPRAERRLVPLIRAMNGEDDGKASRERQGDEPSVDPLIAPQGEHARARIYVPTARLEAVLHFGDYNRSLLHLVSRAFEDRHLPPSPTAADGMCETRIGAPRPFLGMADIARRRGFKARTSIQRLSRVASQKRPEDRVSQSDLTADTTIQESIFNAIAAMQSRDRHFEGVEDGEDHD